MQTFQQYMQSQTQITPELRDTINSVVSGCLKISANVRLGALAGILGEAGTGNVQGEAQKKLDVIANQILIDELKQNVNVAGLASEEEDDFVACHEQGDYLVLFDPLDGSSNIDVNISIGTIFSVLKRDKTVSDNLKVAGCNEVKTEDFLQKGSAQVAAGYVLYGVQTVLVLTFKNGVNVFTLNDKNEFIQTHSHLQIPIQTAEFAINASNQRHWEPPVQQYIADLLAGTDGVRGKNYNMRWVASMVAEVHRILMRGGVFLYPKDKRDPSKAGKLRLMYEANPLGLVVEQAGGKITNARENMLEIQPTGLHQRVAVVLGSTEEVEKVRELHA